MKVYWTLRAKRHLHSIFEYIAQDSIEAANRTIDRLTKRSSQLAAFPKSGRVLSYFDDDDIREIIEGNYRIVYHILPKQINVVAVLHTARNSILG